MISRRLTRWPAAALLCLALLPGCGADGASASDTNPDPSFDLWCEDTLCAWSVDEGAIERAPTWHRSDHGTLLQGDPVVLSQLLERGSAEVGYLRFETITDFDEGVELFLELDLGDDGEMNYSHPVPRAAWRKVSYPLHLSTEFSCIRLRVRKVGAGRAVLAQIKVFVAPPLPEVPYP